jgi:hypothetical protein
MGIRSTRSIYVILETRLREAEHPLTVNDLMEFSDVREEAFEEFGKDAAHNKVSDTLGFMWRRGLLTRYPAPRTEKSFARYGYVWDMKDDSKPLVPIQQKVFENKRSCGD